MYLTREEEKILAGEMGEARAEALKIIVKVGEALGAERLVPIAHAHVSGISYGTIGDHGASLLEDLASRGARVAVPTTVNPVGYDTEDPSLLEKAGVRITPEFVRGQSRILSALRRMGANLTLTCTPYYIPEVRGIPVGSSVAWGESNAILYANSVLGLRTNREGGPLALMAALTGRTYYWGMHLDQERVPQTLYHVEEGILDEARAGVLGEIIATSHRNRKPPLVDARLRDEIALREFLAALGAAGSLAMAHIQGVTPEKPPEKPEERIMISAQDLEERLDKYRPTETLDVVFIGCPHAKAGDVERLARLLQGASRVRTRIVVTLSRREYSRLLASNPRVIGELSGMGVVIARDTCLIVSPFGKPGTRVATNSYKALFYLSKRGVKVSLAPLEDLARIAVSGV